MMRTLNIFVSGTITDLQEERILVENAITNNLHFESIRAETRSSSPLTPEEECKRMVDECDILIGIYGKRYGFRPRGDKSATEMEYDWASHEGKKTLIYVKDVEESELEKEQRIFIERVTDFTKGHFRGPKFKCAEQLAEQVVNDIIDEVVLEDYLLSIIYETGKWRGLNLGRDINIQRSYVMHRIHEGFDDLAYKPAETIGKSSESDVSTQLHHGQRDVSVNSSELWSMVKAIQYYFQITQGERASSFDPTSVVKELRQLMNIVSEEPEVFSDSVLLKQVCERGFRDPNALIMGTAGSGKTTLMIRWANLLAREALAHTNAGLVPISLSLAWLASMHRNRMLPETVPEAEAFTQKERGKLVYHKPLQMKLEQILRSGKGILLLDGLDEVDIARQKELTDWVRQQNYRYPSCPVVITTRPAGYHGGIPSFQEFEILPFDDEQVETFVSLWFSDSLHDYREVLRALKKDEGLERLAQNPLLLAFLCAVFEKVPEGIRPKQEYGLYDSCVNLLLEQWDRGKGIGSIDRSGARSKFSSEDRLSILKDVALFFFVADQGVFHKSDLFQRVETVLSEIEPRILHEERENIDHVVNDIEMNSGILKRLSPGYYSFYNRTFQEYFAARALYDVAQRGQNWLQIVVPHFWEPKWSEVCRVLIALLPDQAQTLLIKSMEFIPKEWGWLVDTFHGKGDRVLVLLEDNYVNWRARLNQARMLKVMAYSQCVKLVCSAGAIGAVDTSPVSSFFLDRKVRLKTAFLFLKSLELTAEEFCSIMLDRDLPIVGVEDRDLYREQVVLNAKYRRAEMSGLHEQARHEEARMLELHERVPGVYVDNTLKEMEEKRISVAVLSTGAFDMPKVSRELKKRNLSYFWIRAKAEGPDNYEEYQKMLLGWRRPVDALKKEMLHSDEELPFF